MSNAEVWAMFAAASLQSGHSSQEAAIAADRMLVQMSMRFAWDFTNQRWVEAPK